MAKVNPLFNIAKLVSDDGKDTPIEVSFLQDLDFTLRQMNKHEPHYYFKSVTEESNPDLFDDPIFVELDELPEKTEIVRNIDLSDLEMLSYESMRERIQSALEGEDKVTVNALAEITRLRQAACSMSLVDDSWTGGSSKIDCFSELISDILSSGNRVLVFSQFTSFLSLAVDTLKKMGVEHFYLDGSTPIKKREQMVRDFQNGDKQVFVVSLKAGGLGLNLTGANYVIHLDPWWNPAIEQQATDRAHRIGQKQPVTVYHLISSHTIEEKILRLHKTKRDLADTFLSGTDVAHTLSIDDLRNLVEIEN